MSLQTVNSLDLSAVIPVGRRVDDLAELLGKYDDALQASGASYELLLVFDGNYEQWKAVADEIARASSSVRVIELSKEFGEASALAAGFDAARGERVLTLPSYYQVDPAEITTLVKDGLGDADMLVAVRPRSGASFDKLRRRIFHRLFRMTSGLEFQDLGCGVRLLKRDVVQEIDLYGEQHRFFPALAAKKGFRVREVVLKQSEKDLFRGRYGAHEYVHRFLDILTVFFLVRFTKKPLRFFGTIGFVAASIGGLFTLVLVIQRLFFGMPLADRPALLLASLLLVLGVQTFAIGLIGELIIFTHASNVKEYAIRRIIEGRKPDTLAELHTNKKNRPNVQDVG